MSPVWRTTRRARVVPSGPTGRSRCATKSRPCRDYSVRMVTVHLVPVRPTAATADDAQRLALALLEDPRPGAAATAAAWQAEKPSRDAESAPCDGELSVQFDDVAAAVGLALWAVRTGSWAVVLVAGADWGQDPPVSHLEAADRRHARRAPGRLVLAHGQHPARAAGPDREADLRCVEATLQLVARLEQRRSGDQNAAGRLVEGGASQREAAAELGISQQAVHSRLRHGLWHESRTATAAVLPLLERLAADPGD